MLQQILFAALLLLLLSAHVVVQGKTEDDSSYLKVMVPPTVGKYFSDNQQSPFIAHSQALFGSPRYGGDKRILGQVFYLTEDRDVDGCQYDLPHDMDAAIHNSSLPKIFLVDRGQCDFVTKVRHAQSLGASAVIIADNVCQCEATMNWPREVRVGRTKELKNRCEQLGVAARQAKRITGTCEAGLPFMADDGNGQDVTIPSFLVSFLDAQILKDCISNEPHTLSGMQCSNDQKLILSLEWDLAQLSTVEWSLWSSSDSEGTFKKAFAPLFGKLQGKTHFQPRYFIWDGKSWGCDDQEGVCGSQCVEGGLYCNPDPASTFFDGVTGAEVVEENLRQLCVWEQASKSDKPQLWWDYVAQFARDCHPTKQASARLFTPECSESVHKKIPGLSYAATKQCVQDSWGAGKKTNTLLDEQLHKRSELKILQLPTAIVNGQLLRGGVTQSSVLSAVCAGYVPGSAPQVCDCVNSLTSVNNIESCLNSFCPVGQLFCQKTKQCYASQHEYDLACNPVCSQGLVYCPSLLGCVNAAAGTGDKKACPECPSAAAPVYCVASKQCVANVTACTAPDSGTSVIQVVLITVFVVLAAVAVGFRFWKRQQARLHDDVRAILESYRALDHEGGGGGSGNGGFGDEDDTPKRTAGNEAAALI